MNDADEIIQIDPVLAEDGRAIVFFGHTADRDRTFIASLELPIEIDPENFLMSEWRDIAMMLDWHLA